MSATLLLRKQQAEVYVMRGRPGECFFLFALRALFEMSLNRFYAIMYCIVYEC